MNHVKSPSTKNAPASPVFSPKTNPWRVFASWNRSSLEGPDPPETDNSWSTSESFGESAKTKKQLIDKFLESDNHWDFDTYIWCHLKLIKMIPTVHVGSPSDNIFHGVATECTKARRASNQRTALKSRILAFCRIWESGEANLHYFGNKSLWLLLYSTNV